MRRFLAGAAIIGALAYIAGQNNAVDRIYSLLKHEPVISRAALEEYNRRQKANYEEFMRSEPVERKVPVPEDAPTVWRTPEVPAFDFNEDGQDEILLLDCSQGIGCSGAFFEKTESGYRQILGKVVNKVSHSKTNGYRDAFTLELTDLPTGGAVTTVKRHRWDSGRYVESETFLLPTHVPYVKDSIRSFSRKERNPQRREQAFLELENVIGTHHALQALVLSQMPPNIPLPTDDVEYERLLIQLTEDTGVEYRNTDNPDDLRVRLYSSLRNKIAFDRSDPAGWGITSGVLVAESIVKEFGMDANSQYRKALRKVNSRFAQYVDSTEKDPRPQRLAEIFEQGPTFTIRENELRPIQSPDTSTYGRSSSPSGTVEWRSFTPSQVPGDPRYLNSQPRAEPWQERSRQIDQATRQQLQQDAERGRQMLNQGIDQGRQLGGKVIDMLRPQDPNKQEKPPEEFEEAA